MQHYAFTVKYLNSDWKDYTEDELKKLYELVLTEWTTKGAKITYKIYEHDKQLRLHVHGIIELSKRFYLKRLSKPGYTVKLALIWDERGWLKYMIKEQPHQETDKNDLSFLGVVPTRCVSPEIVIPKRRLF